MKIDKLKKYQSLAFATVLSLLTGCSYTGNIKTESTAIEDDSVYKYKNHTTFTSPLDIRENNIHIFFEYNTLYIEHTESMESNKELSPETYQAINEILSDENNTKICLIGINDEIDFSKLNLENIKDINLRRCGEKLDCTAFVGQYEEINFSNTTTESAIHFLSNCDCSKATVFCSNLSYKSDMSGMLLEYTDETFVDLDVLAKFLIDNDIFVNELHIHQRLNFSSLEKETIEKICQVNAKWVSISSDGYDQPVDLNIVPNEKLDVLILHLVQKADNLYLEIENGEFGNVVVQKEHPMDILLYNMDITENTHFELPTNSNLSLIQTNCTDITPLNDLKNMQSIIYYITDYYYDNIVYSTHQSCDSEQSFKEFIEKVKQSQENDKVKTYQ